MFFAMDSEKMIGTEENRGEMVGRIVGGCVRVSIFQTELEFFKKD